MNPFDFENVPGKYHLEIYEYQADDPRYEFALPPGAIVYRPTVASFRRQIGGEEGLIIGPSGDKYFISLKPWAGKNQEKTLLRMEFGFTPDFKPLTRQQLLDLPPTPAPNPSYIPQPHRHTANFPGRPIYTMCSDWRYDHKLTLRPGLPGVTTTTANDLMSLPEAAKVGPVICPVCDTPVRMTEPLGAYVQELREVLGEPNPLMEWSLTHPANIPETKTPPPANSPLVVVHYWRYEPVEILPSAQRPAHLKIEVHSKNHFITLELGAEGIAGSFPAGRLLELPEASQKELACSLCDEKLPFHTPFEGFIQKMAAEQGGPERFLIWSVSHPSHQPETKGGDPTSLISARRHSSESKENLPGVIEGVAIRFMM
jgi:hypothetical protein